MKGRNISDFILPCMELVFARDNIPYNAEGGKIYADISSRRFKEAMNDALCEVQKGSCRIPVFTAKTVVDTKKREKLRRFYNSKHYQVLNKDIDNFKNIYA